jgi:hypothetical protein
VQRTGKGGFVVGGYTGDTGDTGDTGNLSGGGAGWTFADRVDLPFISEGSLAQQRLNVGSFGDRRWAPEWAAWLTLADFATTGWQARIAVDPPPTPPTEQEMSDLVTMAVDERPDALGEIVSQDQEFMSYFLVLLNMTPGSHPATFRLLMIANLVATCAVMHFKGKYNRPRPSQICPALLPPIQVPGHASYPSGHSTQAHLFAACAEKLQPAKRESMQVLAGRIARNREIAGLHYKSDSAAGSKLAADIFAILSDEALMPRPSRFAAAFANAAAEWA